MSIQPAGVTDGCNNPIIGGGGNLVYPSIRSPDFSLASQTGWAIFKNGNAYFFNITATGNLLVYNGAPAAGNLIYSVTNAAGTDIYGNNYLKGTSSYANDGFGSFIQQFLAGIVFGNTTFPTSVSGAAFINFNPGGTLQISAGSAGGAIQLNQDGSVELLTGRWLKLDNSTLPGSAVNGSSVYSAGGHQKYLSPDGNAYNTGRLTLHIASPGTTINSTAPIPLFTYNVSPGYYRVHGVITGVNGGAGTLQPQTIQVNGTATYNTIRLLVRSTPEGTATSTGALSQITAAGTSPANPRTPALGEIFTIEFDGTINVSAAGTFIIGGLLGTSNADVTWLAATDSFCDLMPVT